jgi:hypothetical protein
MYHQANLRRTADEYMMTILLTLLTMLVVRIYEALTVYTSLNDMYRDGRVRPACHYRCHQQELSAYDPDLVPGDQGLNKIVWSS